MTSKQTIACFLDLHVLRTRWATLIAHSGAVHLERLETELDVATFVRRPSAMP